MTCTRDFCLVCEAARVELVPAEALAQLVGGVEQSDRPPQLGQREPGGRHELRRGGHRPAEYLCVILYLGLLIGEL